MTDWKFFFLFLFVKFTGMAINTKTLRFLGENYTYGQAILRYAWFL